MENITRHQSDTQEANDSTPIPGTALTAFLRRYRASLAAAGDSPDTTRLIRCCDQILLAAERGLR